MILLKPPLALRRARYFKSTFWTAYAHRFPHYLPHAIRLFKMRRILICGDRFYGEASQSDNSILDGVLQLSNDCVHLSHRHVTINCNFENAYDERSSSSQPEFLDTLHLAVRMDH